MEKVYEVAAWVRKKQDGLTTVEYAIAGGLITAAVVGAFIALGGQIDTVIRAIITALQGGGGDGGG